MDTITEHWVKSTIGKLSNKVRHDYSQWSLEDFQRYFAGKDLEPVDNDEYAMDHSMSTVCGVLREVGRRNKREDIEYLLKIAMTMTKKMSAKLQEYWQKERDRRK